MAPKSESVIARFGFVLIIWAVENDLQIDSLCSRCNARKSKEFDRSDSRDFR